MASSLKVNRVVPSTGTNIGLGTANGQIRLASTSKLTFDGDTNTYINHPSADTIAAFTAGSERLRLNSSGNVGINTTTTPHKLTVKGTISQVSNSGSGIQIVNLSQDGSNNGSIVVNDSSGVTRAQFLASGVSYVRGGNFGVGLTNPSNALDVQGGSTNTAIVARSTDAKAQVSLLDNSTTSVGSVCIGAEGDNLFLTSGSGGGERLRINSDGRILVAAAGGTLTPRIVSTSVNAFAQIEGTTYHQSALSITRNTDDQWGGYVIIGKSRGTSVGGIGTLTDGDIVGEFRFAACDGTDMVPMTALIRSEIDGAVGVNSTPGALTFRTTAAGNVSTNERLRIKADGDIEAGGNLKTNNLPGNNLLHNGEFAIWQRGTTAIYSSQNKYLADRFKFISNTDGNGSVHQHTNVPTVDQTGGSKFAYSLRLNCTTADTSLSTLQYINLSQRIEGRDLRHLGFGQAGTRYATLSFWQRSPSGTYHVSFRNSAYNRYYLASYTAANNTWEKHELTIPIDTGGTWATDHSIGLDITWSLGGGSGYISGTVGSWQNSSSHAGSGQKNFFDTVGNDFYITGVQFEKGSIATPFEHKSYGEDLLQCQRYLFSVTPPVGFINATEDLGAAFASSANEVQFPIKFPVEMRATPSVEQVTGSNYFRIGQGNLGGDKYISGNWIVNNMSPNCGNLYTDPDANLSSYIGQMATIQLKNTAARLYLRSEL